MSGLQDFLKKFESEQLPGNTDTEKDDSETAAIITENEKSHYVSVGRSKLRPVAEPTDKKYAGKKVSREELEQDSDEENEDGEDYDDDFSDDEEEAELLAKMNSGAVKQMEEEKEEEEEDMSKYFLVQGEPGEDEEDYEDEDEEEENEDDDDDSDSAVPKEIEGMSLEDLQNRHDADDESIASSDAGDIGALEDLDIFKRREEEKESSSTQLSEAEIGRGLISQIELHDQLVQLRIRFQKLLALAAQLPPPEQLEQFNLGSGAAIKEKYAKVQEKILETFISMAKVTKKLNESSAEVKCERFNSSSAFSNKFWGVITNQRQSVFAKTWESVQHSGGNDPNKAVNAIMADPDRLLRRSRLRKSFTARRLGVENNEAEQDEEHYDDTGLYQSILRNLINSKANTADPSNTTELNKHWLKLQRLEKKTKKVNVDTKASKGRKIRYNVHQKLVGFFPKADKAEWTHERRNQLFRGVFQC